MFVLEPLPLWRVCGRLFAHRAWCHHAHRWRACATNPDVAGDPDDDYGRIRFCLLFLQPQPTGCPLCYLV